MDTPNNSTSSEDTQLPAWPPSSKSISEVVVLSRRYDESAPDYETLAETAQRSKRFWIVCQNHDQAIHYAKQLMPGTCYEKPSQNEWWNGYLEEKNIIISQMSSSHPYYSYQLLNFCELGNPFPIYQMRSKSPKFIVPEKICITSQWTIEELFKDDPIMCKHLVESFQLIKIINRKVMKRVNKIKSI